MGWGTSRTAGWAGATVVALLLASVGVLALQAPATGAAAQVGNDISWPQCAAPAGYGNPMPADGTGFVVLGLTQGLPFSENPCLADQARWIRDRARPFQAYTMAAYPTGDDLARYGTNGPFSSGSTLDQVRNAGYNQAVFAVKSLQRIGLQPSRVWVDVEIRKGQPWPTGSVDLQTANRAAIEGVLAGFAANGFATGLYSNASGWKDITGNWQRPDLPFWATAGPRTQADALAKCSSPGLNGGPVYLAQWWDSSPTDWDIACPGHELAAPPATLSWPAASGGWSAVAAAGVSASGLTLAAGPSRAQAWSLTVQDACSGATVRTLTGTSSDRIVVRWDGQRDDGSAAGSGVYRATLSTGVKAPDGPSYTVLHELVGYGTHRVGACRSSRVTGPDVYATAVEIGRSTFPSSRTVVLASSDAGHVVDAVTAAPYARALKAPLLLTPSTGLPDAVTADLQRRGATSVVVVGGPSAVSSAVTDALTAQGIAVSRVAGADRYATAALLAARIGSAGREILVASGDDASLTDALLAAGPAAGLALPVLLVTPTSVPTATQGALKRLSSAKATVTVVGPTTAISAGVAQWLRGKARIVRRIGSTDRAGEAAALASAYATRLGAGGVVMVNSAAPVTLLAAGALGRAILLTTSSAAAPASTAWLRRYPKTTVRVVGLPTLVAPGVLVSIGR